MGKINREQKSVKDIWEKEAKAYNAIFDFLESKNLTEKDLKEFSLLLVKYTKLQ